jgi:hypothetical protein
MNNFSLISAQRLATCDPRLQRLMNEVLQIIDITIVCGHRSKDEQEKAFNERRTKLHWPNSKHNSLPSKAVDIAPYRKDIKGIDWNGIQEFIYLAGIVQGVAKKMGYEIRWGGDWNSNFVLSDETFRDFPHFEIVD